MSIVYASAGLFLRPRALESSRRFLVLGSIAALAVGIGIYVLFRPESVVALSDVGLVGHVIWFPRGALATFGVFSLPGLLWVLSATLGQAAIWFGQRNFVGWLWLTTPLVVGCLWESGQAVGLLRGTADLLDILACLVGWGLGTGAAVLCDSNRL